MTESSSSSSAQSVRLRVCEHVGVMGGRSTYPAGRDMSAVVNMCASAVVEDRSRWRCGGWTVYVQRSVGQLSSCVGAIFEILALVALDANLFLMFKLTRV